MTVVNFPRGDDEARRAIAEDLDDTLVVEAAAGTGKTTELVTRILRVLATGRATMTEIVAVTFTEKAAGELKLRLRERLERDRADVNPDGEIRQRLDHALETLEEAHVNTIHGFCAELLRERPVEACVDPLFSVLTEPQSARLYDRAFSRWLEQTLKRPPDGVRRALRRTSMPSFGDTEPSGPVDRLRRAGRDLAEARDFTAPWSRRPFDRDAIVDRQVAALHRLAELSAAPASTRDNLFVDLDGVRRLSTQIRLEQSFGYADRDGWEARLIDLLRDKGPSGWGGFSRTRKGSGYKYGKDVTRTDLLAARDQLFADLQQFKRDADADLAAALQQEMREATAAYQALKAAAGALDFADLLVRTRDMLRSDGEVRRHLQRKCRRIFVDEFQDTDPVQAEIFLLLSADDPAATEAARIRPVPGKLFIVGDPKQAIYRFRGTDVATYRRVRDQLAARGGRVVQLTKSFRSVPEIQHFVNTAFRQCMQRNDDVLQAEYIALSESRRSVTSQPAVIALPVPSPYTGRGTLKASPRAIEASLPDAVGAFIEWLVNPRTGWTVAEPQPADPERRVPIQPKHVAVLFRRFVSFGDDVTKPYTEAIEARGIPHLLVGGKSFHGREEVEAIRAALAAIEWPDDELSVFATLKGSFFAIDDEALLEFRHRFGAFHPFRIPRVLGGNSGHDLELSAEPTAQLMPIAEALRALQDLHRRRNYRPVADTVTALMASTRAHVGFILRPAGEQVLANVLHIAELARQYEAGGGISFRGFIDELRAAAASEGAEAPILEENSDGVRLMTVHKAKGLEFPVVILADLTCRMSRNDASRYADLDRGLCAIKIGGWAPHELHEHEALEVARDEAEGVRLAYVAATRARDLLVVPALGDEPWDGGWLSPLNAALYPPQADRRTAERGAGCPAFKSKDTVLERPNGEVAGASTVCPGLHRLAGDYGVVWWDPHALALGAKASYGVRRDDLIVKDVPKTVVADGRSEYDRWRLAQHDARARGSVASVALATVREWTEDPERAQVLAADAARVTVANLSAGHGPRSGGAAFGVLVHAIVAQAPLDGSTADRRAVAALEARILGLTDEVVGDAVEAVERFLRHDLGRRATAAAAATRCRRETPVTFQAPDGVVVEGVVDLAFEEDGRWVVVDFKTDRELDVEGEARYRRQVAAYAAAIAQATGLATEGILVRL